MVSNAWAVRIAVPVLTPVKVIEKTTSVTVFPGITDVGGEAVESARVPAVRVKVLEVAERVAAGVME